MRTLIGGEGEIHEARYGAAAWERKLAVPVVSYHMIHRALTRSRGGGGVLRVDGATRLMELGRRVFLCVCLLAAWAPAPARAETPRLLVLGDSLAAGYGLAASDGFQARLGKALADAGYPVRMIDAAVSGDTTAGGRARLDWALADGADAAIVELGGNDGLRGIDPADTRANLAAILDALAARHIPVLLSGMYAPPNLGDDYEREFRAVFDALGKRPGVMYDPFFLEGVATDAALDQADGIHPNPEGVRRIVARLLPMVESLLDRAAKS